MRTRHILLALLIIVCGLLINASRQGTFAELNRQWRKELFGLPEALPALQQSSLFQGDWQEVKRNKETLPIGAAEQLIIDNPFGHIYVTGKDQSAITLETVKWGRALTAEEALRNSDLVKLRIVNEGATLQLLAEGPTGYSQKAQIDLYLTVPPRFAANLKSFIGNIYVENLQGRGQAETISGRITSTQLGEIEANSVSGEIYVTDSRGPVTVTNKSGYVSLENISGACRVSNISGESIGRNLTGPVDMTSISGTINFQDYGGPAAVLKSTTGEIAARLSQPFAGTLSLTSISSPLNLYLSPDLNCRVNLDAGGGEVSSTLPLIRQIEKGNHISGVLGQGRGNIQASTVSGSIYLAPFGD